MSYYEVCEVRGQVRTANNSVADTPGVQDFEGFQALTAGALQNISGPIRDDDVDLKRDDRLSNRGLSELVRRAEWRLRTPEIIAQVCA
jgi:hypothetical protein